MAENEDSASTRPPPTGDTQTSGERSIPARIPVRKGRFFIAALLFESSLGLAALVVGGLVGFPLEAMGVAPQSPRISAPTAVGVGLLAAAPLLVGLVLFDRWPPTVLRSFRDQVIGQLVPLFRTLKVVDLALISVAAGVGEELLFRGLIQRGIEFLLGGSAAVALPVASLLFGLCHYLNATYVLLAGLVGLYLGALLLATDQLLTPIVTHAAYDFAALLYLTRRQS